MSQLHSNFNSRSHRAGPIAQLRAGTQCRRCCTAETSNTGRGMAFFAGKQGLSYHTTTDKYPKELLNLPSQSSSTSLSLEHRPPAACDGSSVDYSPLVPVDYALKSYTGEIFPRLSMVLPIPPPQERSSLLKMYDSSSKVRAKCGTRITPM